MTHPRYDIETDLQLSGNSKGLGAVFVRKLGYYVSFQLLLE